MNIKGKDFIYNFTNRTNIRTFNARSCEVLTFHCGIMNCWFRYGYSEFLYRRITLYELRIVELSD